MLIIISSSSSSSSVTIIIIIIISTITITTIILCIIIIIIIIILRAGEAVHVHRVLRRQVRGHQPQGVLLDMYRCLGSKIEDGVISYHAILKCMMLYRVTLHWIT